MAACGQTRGATAAVAAGLGLGLCAGRRYSRTSSWVLLMLRRRRREANEREAQSAGSWVDAKRGLTWLRCGRPVPSMESMCAMHSTRTQSPPQGQRRPPSSSAPEAPANAPAKPPAEPRCTVGLALRALCQAFTCDTNSVKPVARRRPIDRSLAARQLRTALSFSCVASRPA